MAVWGEVSVKVKRSILLAEKFTVGQIADITGIKFQSVETVIQRLLKEGILIRAEVGNLVSPGGTVSKKGRPKQYYTFANAEKVKILRDSLDALLIEQSMVEPSRHKPNNPHFVKAVSIIDSMESSRSEVTDGLLNEIENNLSLSKEYEEMVGGNNEITMAYIDFAQARLEYLREEEEDAEKLLKSAKNIFKKHQMPEEYSVDEYLITSILKLAVHEAQKTFKTDKYDILADKLNNLSTVFPSFSFLPYVTTQIKEFIKITGQSSSFTAELINKNKVLEEQNRSLLEENERLKIQQMISSEINLNLSEAVKSISLPQEFNYPQQKLPKSILTVHDEKLESYLHLDIKKKRSAN